MTRLFGSVLLLLFWFEPGALAQPDRVQEWLDQAIDALERGRDAKALTLLERVLKDGPNVEALGMSVEINRNLGHLDQAEALGLQWLELAKDRTSRLVLAEVLYDRGKLDAVKEIIEPLQAPKAGAPPDQPGFDLPARAWAGLLLQDQGKDKDAEAVFDTMLAESKRVVVREADDLVALAKAYEFYGGRSGCRAAEKALADAQKKNPESLQAYLALGKLYRSKFYLPGDAVEEFKQALKIRPGWCEAHVGLARSYDEWMKGKDAESHKSLARAINPNHPWLLKETVVEHLGNMELEKAREILDKLRERSPRDLEVLALEGAHELLQGSEEGFAKHIERIKELDPTFGEGFLLAVRVLNERRRWSECLELCRRAAQQDAANPAVFEALARYAFFLGHEEEGRTALARADKLDAFGNVWRKNMWEVARVLKAYYHEVRTEHFIHRLHKKDEKVLSPYLQPFAEQSFTSLTAKYKFVPTGLPDADGRILVETFRSHEDFAARTHGFQHLGATGVCFGPFIAQDSPTARKPGEFSWARTFHHELAHTITLGISKGRVPRWLTEGLSSYEETCFHPGWYRPHYRDLFDARANGEILKVLEFDAAFRGSRIGFAYFQGGLVSAWMADRFGWDKILALLAGYGEDKSTAALLKEVCGVTPEEFDAGFAKYVDKILEPVRFLPRWSSQRVSAFADTLKETPTDLEALVGLATARIDASLSLDAEEFLYRAKKTGSNDPRLDFLQGRLAFAQKKNADARKAFEAAAAAGFSEHTLHRDLGVLLEAEGEKDRAKEQFLLALATYPMAQVASEDPRLRLASLARSSQNPDEATKWMEEHLTKNFENIEVRKQLIGLYRTRGDQKNLRRHLEDMLLVNPFDGTLHGDLGRLHLEQREGKLAMREFRVALDLLELQPEKDRQPKDGADARVGLARALLLVDGDDAKAEAQALVEQALALVPGHAEAKKLRDELGTNGR